jgi:hypothetical protein
MTQAAGCRPDSAGTEGLCGGGLTLQKTPAEAGSEFGHGLDGADEVAEAGPVCSADEPDVMLRIDAPALEIRRQVAGDQPRFQTELNARVSRTIIGFRKHSRSGQGGPPEAGLRFSRRSVSNRFNRVLTDSSVPSSTWLFQISACPSRPAASCSRAMSKC